MSRVLAACRSSPQTTCLRARMERPSLSLVGHDGLREAFSANVVLGKGRSHGYTKKETPVLRKVMLPSDQQPSIIDVKHKASTRITTEIVHEERPVGDSNSNGSIKRAEQTIPGQTRAIKDFTERQIGATMGHDNLEVACATCGLDTGDISCRRRRGNSAPAHQWHTIQTVDRRGSESGHSSNRATPRDQSRNPLCNGWTFAGSESTTRTGAHTVSDNAALTTCRSIRRRNNEERWESIHAPWHPLKTSGV